MFTGIKLAHELHVLNLDVESVSDVLIYLFQNEDIDNRSLGNLIKNCGPLLLKFDYVQLRHVNRERNKVADILAK